MTLPCATYDDRAAAATSRYWLDTKTQSVVFLPITPVDVAGRTPRRWVRVHAKPTSPDDLDRTLRVLADGFLCGQLYRGIARSPEGAAQLELAHAFLLRGVGEVIAKTPSALTVSRRSALQGIAAAAFANPGSEDVVAALAELVANGHGYLDVVAWPWLWVWAWSSKAQPRTRMFAMRAINAILTRKTFPPSADLLQRVERLRRLIADLDEMWPTYGATDRREKALLVSEANALVGAAVQQLVPAGFDTSHLAPIPPPPPPPMQVPSWLPVAGAGVLAVFGILGVLAWRGRARSGAQPSRSRARSA